MHTHTHNGDPAKGPVCSHLLTDAVQIALGITARETTKIVGTPTITRPGLAGAELRQARLDHPGIRVCTLDPRPKVFKRPGKMDDPVHVTEALEFCATFARKVQT